MAHIAVINLPAHGHINPTLGVVRELTARGHRVTYYAGEAFRPRIEASGAAYRAYSPALNGMAPPANLFATARMLAEQSEALLPGLLADARAERPDAIVYDSLAHWGAALAALTGAPAICSTTTFAITPRATATAPRFLLQIAGMAAAGLGDIAAYRAAMGRMRRAYGLRPTPLPAIFCNQAGLNIVYTARDLQPAADSLGPSWHFVGPTLPSAAPAEPLPLALRAGRPFVYISLGTLYNANLPFYRACLGAFAGGEADVLIATGGQIRPSDLGPLPPNITLVPFAPQLAALARADLFITHGGMNSVHEGLWHGVPLLVAPQAAEQAMVASRVANLGAGLALGPIDAARLRAAAGRLLAEPAYRERARALGAGLRAGGGAAQAADLILAQIAARPLAA